MTAKTMSSSIEIAAEPEAIFAIIANPHRHPEIDGSGTLGADIAGPDRLVLGSRFKVKVDQGWMRYPTTNRVVEYEPNRLIAWRHIAPQRWRYELEPLRPKRTRVTESMDYGYWGPLAFIARRAFHGDQAAIERHLARLKEVAEEGVGTGEEGGKEGP